MINPITATRNHYQFSKFRNTSQDHREDEELLVSSDRDLAITTKAEDTTEEEVAVTHVTTNVDHVTVVEEAMDMVVEEAMDMVVDRETITIDERMITVMIMKKTMKNKDQEEVDIEVPTDQEVGMKAKEEEVKILAQGQEVVKNIRKSTDTSNLEIIKERGEDPTTTTTPEKE